MGRSERSGALRIRLSIFCGLCVLFVVKRFVAPEPQGPCEQVKCFEGLLDSVMASGVFRCCGVQHADRRKFLPCGRQKTVDQVEPFYLLLGVKGCSEMAVVLLVVVVHL